MSPGPVDPMKLGGDVAVTRVASLWAAISGKSDASDHRSQRGIRPSTRTRHGHRIAEQAQDGCVKPGDGRQAARSALPRRSLARPVHRPVYAKETADALAAEGQAEQQREREKDSRDGGSAGRAKCGARFRHLVIHDSAGLLESGTTAPAWPGPVLPVFSGSRFPLPCAGPMERRGSGCTSCGRSAALGGQGGVLSVDELVFLAHRCSLAKYAAGRVARGRVARRNLPNK